MNNIIVACEMIRDEVLTAMSQTGCTDPVEWVDDTLHLYPAKLRVGLQVVIDRVDAPTVDHLLFAFGYCGNAFVGLRSGSATVVLPRVNDCTEMLTCNLPQRPVGSYFLTRGWMDSDKALAGEYDHYVRRYGEKRAQRIMNVLLAHYTSMTLVDTGAYDVEALRGRAQALADRLGLTLQVLPGTIQTLTRLFSAQWDDGFVIVPPHTEVTMDHFGSREWTTLSQGQRVE